MPYNNAPIKEAVFDIRVSQILAVSIEDLSNFSSYLPDGFSFKNEIIQFQGKFAINKKLPIEENVEKIGLVFEDKSLTNQIQIRFDGLTLNVLKPYKTWDEHFGLFKIVSERFLDVFKPKISKLAIRYINKIEIPLPIKEFEEYIINMPQIPKCLPQSLSHFFMQIRVPYEKYNKEVNITETMENSTLETLPFIFDIDVFQDQNIPLELNEILDEFEKMRTIKNEIFENCITDRTRQLFL